MKLVSIDLAPGARTGVLIGSDVLDFAPAGDVLPFARWVPSDMCDLLAGGDTGLDLIRRLIDQVQESKSDEAARLRKTGALRPYDEVKLAPAVPRPGILLSHGRAYKAHRDEMSVGKGLLESDLSPKEPKAFLKNINSIIGSGADVTITPVFPQKCDWEGEFSIVFGMDCYNVTPEEALSRVIGYTLVNDISSRDSGPLPKPGEPIEWDLIRAGKQAPGYTPLGPVITTKDEIPDPHALHMTTTVNGEVMQSAQTSDLIYEIPYLISFFSQFYPFKAGDVLTTGSPSGVGAGMNPPRYLKDGDVVIVSVDQIGELRNRMVSAG